MSRLLVCLSNISIIFLICGRLCTFSVNGQSSEENDFNPYTMCTLVPNGTYINDPNDCVTWIQCVDEEPIYGACENGLFYNLETNECVPADTVTCVSTDPCAAEPNGFAADPDSCNGYYYCANGIASHGSCSNGLNFNPSTASCIRGYNCTLVDPLGYCNIVPEGVFIKNSSSCNGWEMCWEDEVEGGICPGTFYFNAFSGDCDYPENVNCTVQPDLPSGEGVCPEAGAFISDNATCNGYYYCRETDDGEIVLQHGDCPSGRFFNPEVDDGACVPRTDMVCEYDRCAGMGIDAIQLANGSDDECKGYLVCQNGVTIGSGTCPDNAYYDELIQLCTMETVDFRACNGTVPTETTTSTTITESTTTESTTTDSNTTDSTTTESTTTESTTTESTTTDSTTTESTTTESTTTESTTTDSTTTDSTTTDSTTTVSTTTASTTTDSPTTESTTTESTTTVSTTTESTTTVSSSTTTTMEPTTTSIIQETTTSA